MKSGNNDKEKVMYYEIKGKTKEGSGVLTGYPKRKLESKAEKNSGKV